MQSDDIAMMQAAKSGSFSDRTGTFTPVHLGECEYLDGVEGAAITVLKAFNLGITAFADFI